MRRYTKHLQTILQTQNICKTQKSNPHPTKTMEHGKKKDARVHYTVLTQHTHTTTTTHQPVRNHPQCRPTRQPQPHQQGVAYCVLPQTPNSMPTYKNNMFVKQSRPRSATQCICHCGCASTRISKYFLVAVTHSATSTTTRPTTVGTTKQKAP